MCQERRQLLLPTSTCLSVSHERSTTIASFSSSAECCSFASRAQGSILFVFDSIRTLMGFDRTCHTIPLTVVHYARLRGWEASFHVRRRLIRSQKFPGCAYFSADRISAVISFIVAQYLVPRTEILSLLSPLTRAPFSFNVPTPPVVATLPTCPCSSTISLGTLPHSSTNIPHSLSVFLSSLACIVCQGRGSGLHQHPQALLRKPLVSLVGTQSQGRRRCTLDQILRPYEWGPWSNKNGRCSRGFGSS